MAYGICARLARRAVRSLRARSVPVGLFRPITLSPFPNQGIEKLIGQGVRNFLVVELNMGQMAQDVRLAVNGRAQVSSLGQVGGLIPGTEELVRAAEAMVG